MFTINKTIYEAGIIACLKAENNDISSSVKDLKKASVYCVEINVSGCNDMSSLATTIKTERDIAFIISGVTDENVIALLNDAGAQAFCLNPQNESLINYCRQNKIEIIISYNDLQMLENGNIDKNTIVKIIVDTDEQNFEQVKECVQSKKDVLFVIAGEICEYDINDYLTYENVLAFLPTNLQLNNAKNKKEYEQMICAFASNIKKMMNFELCHMGVNTQGMEEAKSMANLFKAMFDFDVIENAGAVFSQSYIEFMAPPFFGKYGHIAIGTNYIDRARSYLERKGFEFNYNSIKTFANSSKIVVIYMKNEIAGFAVHLLQK